MRIRLRAKFRWTARFLPALLFLASLAAARGLVGLTGSTEALVQLFPLKCPLRATTGILCPTCGLGHALVDAWVGRWESSFSHHPLGLVILILCTALSISNLVRPDCAKNQIKRLGNALAKRPRLLLSIAVFYLFVGLIRGLACIFL